MRDHTELSEDSGHLQVLDLNLDIEPEDDEMLSATPVEADRLLMRGVATLDEESLLRLWDQYGWMVQRVVEKRAFAWKWSLSTYFCKRALQALSRFVKREQLRRELPRRLREEGFLPLDVEDDPEKIVTQSLAQEDLKDQLRNAIKTLSPSNRRALVLRYRDNMAFAAIADDMGITEAAAKQRVYRSTVALGKELAMRGPPMA